MKSWTVVLLRPQALCESQDMEYGEVPYVALIQDAKDTTEARVKAQMEAYSTDCKDIGKRKMDNMGIAPHHYDLCVMCRGICQPAQYGWQVPRQSRSEV